MVIGSVPSPQVGFNQTPVKLGVEPLAQADTTLFTSVSQGESYPNFNHVFHTFKLEGVGPQGGAPLDLKKVPLAQVLQAGQVALSLGSVAPILVGFRGLELVANGPGCTQQPVTYSKQSSSTGVSFDLDNGSRFQLTQSGAQMDVALDNPEAGISLHVNELGDGQSVFSLTSEQKGTEFTLRRRANQSENLLGFENSEGLRLTARGGMVSAEYRHDPNLYLDEAAAEVVLREALGTGQLADAQLGWILGT